MDAVARDPSFRSPYVEEWDGSASRRWERFFGEYLPAPGEADPIPPYTRRSLADGGALDNKPFSWATETLLRRRADVPVDRKLLFIAPDSRDPDTGRARPTGPTP